MIPSKSILPLCLLLFLSILLTAQVDIDKDNDGIPDTWEIANGLDEGDPTDAFCDYDGDQVWNIYEYQLGTDPNDATVPISIEVNQTITTVGMRELMEPLYGRPFVVRMSEGIYNFFIDRQNLDPEYVQSTKFMMQGGWNSDNSDYDPFLYSTLIQGRDGAFGRDFFPMLV